MQSLISEWLNENEQRAYPLMQDSTLVVGGISLEQCLVDANIVYTGSVMPDNVALTQIVISSNAVLTISGGQTFTVDFSGSFPQYIRNGQGSLLVVTDSIKLIPAGTYALTDTYFESAVCREFYGDWKGVDSISFEGVSGAKVGQITWNALLQMLIKIKGGKITLQAGKDLGTPVDCTQYFPSIPSDCQDIISFINNSAPTGSPNIFQFIAGGNVVIYEDPTNNRIYIGLNFAKKDICQIPIQTPISNV